MSGCTVKRIDDMEAIFGGAYNAPDRSKLGEPDPIASS